MDVSCRFYQYEDRCCRKLGFENEVVKHKASLRANYFNNTICELLLYHHVPLGDQLLDHADQEGLVVEEVPLEYSKEPLHDVFQTPHSDVLDGRVRTRDHAHYLVKLFCPRGTPQS